MTKTKQRTGHRHNGMTLIELTVVLLILIALASMAVPYVTGTGERALCQATDATMQAIKEAIMGGKGGAGFYGDMLGYYPKTTKSITADFDLAYLLSRPDPTSWGALASFNSKTAVGWRGPYLQSGGTLVPAGLDSSFADVFDTSANLNGKVHTLINAHPQILDAWHRPIVLQVPYFDDGGGAAFHPEYARLISAGPGNGIQAGDAKIDTQINDPIAGNRNTGNFDNDDRVLFLKIPDPAAGGNRPCGDN